MADYGVVLRPKLAGWSEGGQDHIMVKQLDMNNIRVISSVLGQSVALEFHAKKVPRPPPHAPRERGCRQKASCCAAGGRWTRW